MALVTGDLARVSHAIDAGAGTGLGITQERLQALLAANQLIVSELSLPAVLYRIVDVGREITAAGYAAFGLLDQDGHLDRFVQVGLEDAMATAMEQVWAEAVQSSSAEQRGVIRMASIREDPRYAVTHGDDPRFADPAGEFAFNTMLAVPVQAAGALLGHLWLADGRREEFTDADEALVVALAATAGIAIKNSQLYEEARELQEWMRPNPGITPRQSAGSRSDQERLALLQDRDRIARDLHDRVVQRLFAIGLSVQSVAATMPDRETGGRLVNLVGDLDATIGEIRSTIFALRDDSRAETGLRSAVLSVRDATTPLLPGPPEVSFVGPLDTLVDSYLISDVEAVVREGLSNVIRHAGAQHTAVLVRVSGGELEVKITDDGHGTAGARRRSGLDNLRRRAEQYGGSLQINSARPSGTTLRWTIPINI